MRQKLGPWLPAVFCAALSLITVIGDLVGRFATGAPGAVDTAFYAFLPMCFFFVGAFMAELRRENRELRAQIQAMTPGRGAETQVA